VSQARQLVSPLKLTEDVSVCKQGTWGHSPEAHGVMWGWGIPGSFSPGSLYHVVEVLTLLLLVVLLFLHDGCPLSTLCLHVYHQGLGDNNNNNNTYTIILIVIIIVIIIIIVITTTVVVMTIVNNK